MSMGSVIKGESNTGENLMREFWKDLCLEDKIAKEDKDGSNVL